MGQMYSVKNLISKLTSDSFKHIILQGNLVVIVICSCNWLIFNEFLF